MIIVGVICFFAGAFIGISMLALMKYMCSPSYTAEEVSDAVLTVAQRWLGNDRKSLHFLVEVFNKLEKHGENCKKTENKS